MPRTNKKKKKGGARAGDSSEYDTAEETASVTSSHISEPDSIDEAIASHGLDDVDETSGQDAFEEKIRDFIDGTTQKSAAGRKHCFEGIRAAFSKKYIFDFVDSRKITIADCLERSIKKGKGDEQVLAAKLLNTLWIQLGAGPECEEVFAALRPVLMSKVLDKTASPAARASCASALGLGTFIAAAEFETVCSCMNALEDIFSASYLKGDGSSPTHKPGVSTLHTAALNGWMLLLSITPTSRIKHIVETHLPKLPDLLSSDDVNLRIVAGEAIAMLYELAREDDEEFEGDDIDELVVKIRNLATDSNKHRAKKDLRQQRSSFRDIIQTIENGESPQELVKFGVECLEIDSWVRRRQYSIIRESLGSGTNTHLQENPLLRDIFGLGAPLVIGLGGHKKASKTERHNFNSAAFKARTKVRSKQRDKRVAIY
ncbi:interferon-related developmental regulator 2 [Strongylocentrotus purpuratus]|uniref:Interferon-related developmental regulator 1 n=1 Tax=Strongylocentrotus purpuratus TaxID=7668 RepID=A0A7M7PUY2_STRPU|nr:interferon-related developmental regulator 2 [Strongylocentrotus purpuratus]